MKINSIKLENFGSYEGITIFNTEGKDNRNIILIGGKNGAGKTTLFTAMRLCLYGYMSMGYKNYNAYYSKAIIKLINNNAKMTRPANASVELDLSISDGRDLNHFVLRRAWVLAEGLDEQYYVEKNDVSLSDEEKADFEKYLFHLIPPELFNLYFFDGEKIADFFLEEGSNTRIKNAFLTLCGYDTFDIMSKNFKRVYSANESASFSALNEYIAAKEEYQSTDAEYNKIREQLKACTDSIDTCVADINELETNYSQSGGITQEEWNQQLTELKLEEKKRETYNAWLKKVANDYLPFVMIRDQIEALQQQLINEGNNKKYADFCEILESPLISDALKRMSSSSVIFELKSLAHSQYGTSTDSFLDLSFESGATVLSLVQDILDFDPEKIIKAKKSIKSSVAKTSRIRTTLEKSSLDSVHIYMEKKASLLESKSELLRLQLNLESKLHTIEQQLETVRNAFEKSQEKLEEELKKESINDISSKAILMLDKLQTVLYQKRIAKVEDFFRREINALMRKTNFIDNIRIDNDFNIHIFRSEVFDASKLAKILTANENNPFENESSSIVFTTLRDKEHLNSIFTMIAFLKKNPEYSMVLPVEIDKTSLSNGEKQIFIMALYHSLVQLCNHEIPFVIDTPFARIDTEHRQNIAKHFFSQLKGQVFILSTNEEIDSRHVKIMKDKILVTYMLENSDNKRTTVHANTYFEEN